MKHRFLYGGFWRRALAMFFDLMVLYLSVIVILLAAVRVLPEGFRFGSFSSDPGLMVYLLIVVLNMTYFTFFHGMGGRTPGKMVMGLKVVRATGEEMTPGHAFLRWVGYLVSQVAFYLGFLWIAFDRQKQGWHDKIAGTFVIRTRGTACGGQWSHPGPLSAPSSPPPPSGSPDEAGSAGIRERFPY